MEFKFSKLLDVSINQELTRHNELIVGDVQFSILSIVKPSIHFYTAKIILGHIEHPSTALLQLRNTMKSSPVVYICLPNWYDKKLLKYGVFQLKDLSFMEMNDHELYFSKKEL